jgi:heat shock protein HslJ
MGSETKIIYWGETSMFIKDLKFVGIFRLLSIVLLLSTSGFGQSRTQDWFVAGKKIDCVGSVPQKCLLVRKSNAPGWRSFSSPIIRSDFLADFTPEIRVGATLRKNVPADNAALEFGQISVLSRSRSGGDTLEDVLRQSQRQKPLNLSGKKWRIIEINGEVIDIKQATIEFDNRNKRFGARICNAIGGNFKQTGSALRFSRVIATMMACREPLNSIEKGFQMAITKVTRGEQTGNVVTLFAGRTPVLKLRADANGGNQPLAGVRWNLVELNGGEIELDGETPFLQLDQESHGISGSTGCNRFFGKYELAARAIEFTGIGMTKRACLDPVRQRIETSLAQGLSKVTRYQIKRDELQLFSGNRVLMKFIAEL